MTKGPVPESSLTLALAAQVKALRMRRGWTQARLAEAAEMTSDEVSRIERGTREPRFVTIERIAEALEVSPKSLFDMAGTGTGKTGTKEPRPGRRNSPALRRAVEKCLRLLQASLEDE